MVDEIDQLTTREDAVLQKRIDAARGQPDTPGLLDGRCADCLCDIPMARLLAKPNARRCIDCQEEHEEGRS